MTLPGYDYIAARPLFIGYVRAFNTGQPVPDTTVTSQGWVVGVDVVPVGTPIPSPIPLLVNARSTDGTDGLAVPAGTGLEFVINADGLDDIRFNGVSL